MVQIRMYRDHYVNSKVGDYLGEFTVCYIFYIP